MFNEEISNISNLRWMKRIDNYFILLIVVGDMGEKTTETLVSEKTKVNFVLLTVFAVS
jgi:hypothetical protein